MEPCAAFLGPNFALNVGYLAGIGPRCRICTGNLAHPASLSSASYICTVVVVCMETDSR